MAAVPLGSLVVACACNSDGDVLALVGELSDALAPARWRKKGEHVAKAMTSTQKREARQVVLVPRARPGRIALASALAMAFAQGAPAQEVHLNGLGWIKANPGSVIDGETRVVVDGNRAEAVVRATGGKAGLVGNLAGRLQLISVAQANSAGLGAVDAHNTLLTVLRNQLTGPVESVGGAATANVALVSGGDVRHLLDATRIDVLGNSAGNVRAIGGEGDVLLGAIGSFQLPGRASANSALVSESDVRNLYAVLNANVADRVTSVGGAALANALTVAQSDVRDATVILDHNQADRVSASGGAAYVGGGLLASAELTGVSLANAVAVAQSKLRVGQFLATNNQASEVGSVGGSAFANSVNVVGSDSVGFNTRQVGNRASQVSASGGQGSVLAGGLAEVDKSAAALANSISVSSPTAGSGHAHLLVNNQADRVLAEGGGAAANSVWVQQAAMRGSDATLLGNTASNVTVDGGSASVGAGVVAEFAKLGRALANSVVLDQGAEVVDAPPNLSANEATGVHGMGGLAAGNSVLVGSASRVSGAAVIVQDNHAQDVSATGFSGSAGAGLIASIAQKSLALANTLAVFASNVTGTVTLLGNRVIALVSNGGTAQANSASIERGEGDASRLAGTVAITDNRASNLSSGARSSSGAGHAFSTEMDARAAANALVLKDGARLDSAGTLSIAGNQASFLEAVGGTVLVNSLAAYRGATVAAPVSLRDNVASNVSAGGGSSQVVGVGRNRNGVVAVNGLYLDGGDAGAVSLRNTPATLIGNTAQQINANGGRINTNALAINGTGSVSGGSFFAQGNSALRVSSEGSEGTVLGYAAIDRGVGSANANALQVLGRLTDSTVGLMRNQATDVRAEKGLAAANSVVIDKDGSIANAPVGLASNQANGVQASGGKTALANSVLAEGRIEGGSVAATANITPKAAAGSEDAQASSLRVRGGANQGRTTAVVMGNGADVNDGGTANSIDNGGGAENTRLSVASNHATIRGGGTANSVVLERGGSVQGGQVDVLGNHATVNGGGLANSVRSRGAIASSQITILGNQATVNGGGTVNSVDNRGRIDSARIVIASNTGEARGGGTVNSVDNRGQMSGRISIIGNRGTATGGGTVNSVVNHGVLTGDVTIAGNTGSAVMGGTANSLINHGVVSGKVSIVGNGSVVSAGMTAGSVRNMSALVGSAGVSAGVPTVANPGYDVKLPSTGLISNTVTVLPGVNVRNM